MTTETEVLTKEKVKMSFNSLWKIIYHDDNKTSFEFVILSLIEVFRKSPQEAIDLSILIHNAGQAVVATYSTFDVADQKFIEITNFIERFSSSLKVTMEKE